MFRQIATGVSCVLVFLLAGVKAVVWCVNLMCLYHTSGHNMAVTDWLVYLYLYGALVAYIGVFCRLCKPSRVWLSGTTEDDGNPYKTFCHTV